MRAAVLGAHPAVALMLGERTLSYDTAALPFARHVAAALGTTPGALDAVHELLLPAVPPPGPATKGGPWRHEIDARWKRFCKAGSAGNAELMACYEAWIRRVVAPLLAGTGETCVWYSRVPLLRCHTPCGGGGGGGGGGQAGAATTLPPGQKRKGGNRPGILTRRHSDSLPR